MKTRTNPRGARVSVNIGGRVFPSVVDLAKHYGEQRRTVQRVMAEGRLCAFIVGRLLRDYERKGNHADLIEAKRIVDNLAENHGKN